MVFTILGTMSGPIASPIRSQPAYVLHNDKQKILIDAGDGVAGQLAKVNIPLDEVQTIILSHHHIDHIGGLFALLGMRQQTNITTDLAVYGPVGTRKHVDGLIASLQALQDFLSDITRGQEKTAFNTVKVVEVNDGSKFTVGSVFVTAAINTHYNFLPGSADAARFQSLSYRFDLPDRSILFTGDTAPCKKVEELAHNVDLLVSEIMDVDEAMDKIKLKYPNAPSHQYAIVKKHFLDEHLTPDEVGKLAQRSNAKSLVLTHNGGNIQSNKRSRGIIESYFKGQVTFAEDLENY
jgi:ribonuclease BN (tRNA processing enzyme)